MSLLIVIPSIQSFWMRKIQQTATPYSSTKNVPAAKAVEEKYIFRLLLPFMYLGLTGNASFLSIWTMLVTWSVHPFQSLWHTFSAITQTMTNLVHRKLISIVLLSFVSLDQAGNASFLSIWTTLVIWSILPFLGPGPFQSLWHRKSLNLSYRAYGNADNPELYYFLTHMLASVNGEG